MGTRGVFPTQKQISTGFKLSVHMRFACVYIFLLQNCTCTLCFMHTDFAVLQEKLSIFVKNFLAGKRIIATVSDKNSWDTLTKRCFFRSRAPLVPLKVVYRGLVTKSRTPTLRGQGDPKVSQPF